jgi:hypothetical protein
MVDHRSPALVGGTEADQRLDPVAPSLRRFVASFDPVLGFLVLENWRRDPGKPATVRALSVMTSEPARGEAGNPGPSRWSK